MTIKRRIENLENTMAPKQQGPVFLITDEQTEQKSIEQYCAEKGLDIEKFKNKDYGDYMIIQLVPLERQVTDRGLNNGIR